MKNNIKIETLTLGPFMQNVYIAYNEQSRDALIVDPGDEPSAILDFTTENNLSIKAILITHAHIDHIAQLPVIKERTHAPIYLHRDDGELYNSVQTQGQLFGLEVAPPVPVDFFLTHNQAITLLDTEINVIHTPGHSPGGVCFYFKQCQPPFLIVGDTLFQGSIGRTDLWGGNFDTLIQSIKTRLWDLPNETIVLAGHGPNTTIGQEKKSNSFLKN